MTNEDRQEAGRLHWLPAVNMWAMGCSVKLIQKAYGYKTEGSFMTKKNRLKKKHPDWFPPRPLGFMPLIDC